MDIIHDIDVDGFLWSYTDTTKTFLFIPEFIETAVVKLKQELLKEKVLGALTS